MRRIISPAIAAVLLVAIPVLFAQETKPRPAQNLLDEAQKIAKEKKKTVLVVFGASW